MFRVVAVRNKTLKKTLRERTEAVFVSDVKGNEVSSPTNVKELLVAENELIEHELIAAEEKDDTESSQKASAKEKKRKKQNRRASFELKASSTTTSTRRVRIHRQ